MRMCGICIVSVCVIHGMCVVWYVVQVCVGVHMGGCGLCVLVFI